VFGATCVGRVGRSRGACAAHGREVLQEADRGGGIAQVEVVRRFQFAVKPTLGACTLGERLHVVVARRAPHVGPRETIDLPREPEGVREGGHGLRPQASHVGLGVRRVAGREQLVRDRCSAVASFAPDVDKGLDEFRNMGANRFAVAWRERVEVGQESDPLWNAVGHTRHDHASVALAAQDDVFELLELDDGDDVVDVIREGGVGRADAFALTETRQRGGEDLVAAASECVGDGSPLPAAAPCSVYEYERCHVLGPPSGSRASTA
jgi:hypothetical protein